MISKGRDGPMAFSSVAGQPLAKRMLENAVRRGVKGHAYLFAGPRGTGKMAAAWELAKALLCTAPEPGDRPCGQCPDCRKMERGQHPGFAVVEPDGDAIKIDQIRSLQARFHYRPASSRGESAGVYVIRHAERMTAQAANSLLKFLEEPATPVVAVLIAENASALLPTVRSRVQRVPFVPAPPSELERLLLERGVAEELARPASRLAAGIDAAFELASSAWFGETLKTVLGWAERAVAGIAEALVGIPKTSSKWTDDQWETAFELFALWCLDLACLSVGGRAPIFCEKSERMAELASKREPTHWATCAEEAVRARRRLRQHVQPQAEMERLLILLHG